ncbi:hypothetical protein HGM15179_006591 [Zosterops borbonicus]|uniref:Uncharacterized protein n=1 Tax=Zosterops borbonicus TaxID=364589 RepID=A0A8K1GL18_9PASS|nr:hypothetical protein HGM15179_006591 [Zosterops borbonicus]
MSQQCALVAKKANSGLYREWCGQQEQGGRSSSVLGTVSQNSEKRELEEERERDEDRKDIEKNKSGCNNVQLIEILRGRVLSLKKYSHVGSREKIHNFRCGDTAELEGSPNCEEGEYIESPADHKLASDSSSHILYDLRRNIQEYKNCGDLLPLSLVTIAQHCLRIVLRRNIQEYKNCGDLLPLSLVTIAQHCLRIVLSLDCCRTVTLDAIMTLKIHAAEVIK